MVNAASQQQETKDGEEEERTPQVINPWYSEGVREKKKTEDNYCTSYVFFCLFYIVHYLDYNN